MTEPDISRHSPDLMCNKCKTKYAPYGEIGWAPIIDEVACPNCGEKRILYYGNDSNIVKMILSTYGANKELGARMSELESRINDIEMRLVDTVKEARQGMVDVLIKASNEAILEHEKKWHNVKK
jgi:DNA-directed RNA polymerase subunit RPC12/RpoP